MKPSLATILTLCILFQTMSLSAQLNDTTILKLFAYRLGDDYVKDWVSIDTIMHNPSYTKEQVGLPFRAPSGCSEGFGPERYTVHYSLNIPRLDTLEKHRPLTIDVKNDCWFKRVLTMNEGENLNEYNKQRYESIFGYLPDCKNYPEHCNIISKDSIIQKADTRFGKKEWSISIRMKDAKFYWQLQLKKSFKYQDAKVNRVFYDANSGALASIYCKKMNGFEIRKSEINRELKTVKRNDGSRSRTMVDHYQLHFNTENENIHLVGFQVSHCSYTFNEQGNYLLLKNKDYIFEFSPAFSHPKLYTGEYESIDLVRKWDYFYHKPIQDLATTIMFKKNNLVFILESELSYEPNWK